LLDGLFGFGGRASRPLDNEPASSLEPELVSQAWSDERQSVARREICESDGVNGQTQQGGELFQSSIEAARSHHVDDVRWLALEIGERVGHTRRRRDKVSWNQIRQLIANTHLESAANDQDRIVLIEVEVQRGSRQVVDGDFQEVESVVSVLATLTHEVSIRTDHDGSTLPASNDSWVLHDATSVEWVYC
jgi:hypothetical protein